MQTNTIRETLVGLNRVMVTFKLTPESKEEGDAIMKTSTATANDKEFGLVETHVLNYYNALTGGLVLIDARVKKDGTVDMTLERPGSASSY